MSETEFDVLYADWLVRECEPDVENFSGDGELFVGKWLSGLMEFGYRLDIP